MEDIREYGDDESATGPDELDIDEQEETVREFNSQQEEDEKVTIHITDDGGNTQQQRQSQSQSLSQAQSPHYSQNAQREESVHVSSQLAQSQHSNNKDENDDNNKNKLPATVSYNDSDAGMQEESRSEMDRMSTSGGSDSDDDNSSPLLSLGPQNMQREYKNKNKNNNKNRKRNQKEENDEDDDTKDDNKTNNSADDNDDNGGKPTTDWGSVIASGFRFKSRYFHATYSAIGKQCIDIVAKKNFKSFEDVDDETKQAAVRYARKNYGTATKFGRKLRNRFIAARLGSEFIFVIRQPHKTGDFHMHALNKFVKIHHTTNSRFAKVDDLIDSHIAQYPHQGTNPKARLMYALDYVLKDKSKRYILALAENPDEFYWRGTCGRLKTSGAVLRAYITWREQRFQQAVAGALVDIGASTGSMASLPSGTASFNVGVDSGGDDNMISGIENISAAKDVDDDDMIDDDDNIDEKWRPNMHNQLKDLFDKGHTYDELISDKHGKYKKFACLLLRGKSTWVEYEAGVQRRNPPMIVVAQLPSNAVLNRYGVFNANPTYGAQIIKLFYSWFTPCFVHRNAKKGQWILWVWSKHPDCGKTTLWEKGLEGIGQKCQLLQTESGGWFQGWIENGGTCNVIDGYCAMDARCGLGADFLERVGSGLPAILKKRFLVKQPKTRKIPLLVTANSHWSSFFPPHIVAAKLQRRIITIQLTQRFRLFPLIDILLTSHGKQPLPQPQIFIPGDLQAPEGEE